MPPCSTHPLSSPFPLLSFKSWVSTACRCKKCAHRHCSVLQPFSHQFYLQESVIPMANMKMFWSPVDVTLQLTHHSLIFTSKAHPPHALSTPLFKPRILKRSALHACACPVQPIFYIASAFTIVTVSITRSAPARSAGGAGCSSSSARRFTPRVCLVIMGGWLDILFGVSSFVFWIFSTSVHVFTAAKSCHAAEGGEVLLLLLLLMLLLLP
jgi:hypothetical protein